MTTLWGRKVELRSYKNTLFVVERCEIALPLDWQTSLLLFLRICPRRSVTLSWGSGASCVVWIKRARMSHTEDAAARRQSGSTSQPAHSQWVCGGDSGCTRPGLCDTEPRAGYHPGPWLLSTTFLEKSERTSCAPWSWHSVSEDELILKLWNLRLSFAFFYERINWFGFENMTMRLNELIWNHLASEIWHILH